MVIKSGRYALYDEQRLLKDRADKRCKIGWYRNDENEKENGNQDLGLDAGKDNLK